MRSGNHKVRRVWFARGRRAFFGKLQPKNLVVAKVGLALAGSLMLAALPALADQPGMESRRDAWLQFMNANAGAERKELRQLFNVQWKNERNDAPRSIAQPIFQNSSITQSNHSNDGSNFAAGLSRQEARSAERAIRLEQKEAQNLLKQTMQEERHTHKTLQQIAPEKVVNINGRISLDLMSAIENITLGDKLFQHEGSITITVGGQSKTVSAGSKVTAAEYVAAKQVLAAGGQKLAIDSDGRAVGGEVDLSALTNGNQTLKVKDLSIPVAVTATGDFGKGGDVRISGDLINSGSIVAFSSEKNIQNASIFADNITNSQTGSITSRLNDIAQSHGGVVGELNLSLHADDTLTNYGSISSAGDLALTASKSVQNVGASASVTAAKALNVSTPIITNNGVLSSQTGSINISAPIGSDIKIDGTGGVIQALSGDINFGSPAVIDKFDTTISGGDLLSRNLNIYSGHGHAQVIADSVSGYVSIKAGSGRVSALEGDLNILSAEFTGDPMFTAAEDLNIAFLNLTLPGQPITLIAGRDINNILPPPPVYPPDIIPPIGDPPPPPLTTISTAGGATPGHITIIAGAVFSAAFPSGTTVTGPSATGGNVNLGNITTISAGPNNPAPDITIIAFGGTGRGNIDLHSATITTGSNSPNAEDGSVTIIGGGTSIDIGNIAANVPRVGNFFINPGHVLIANCNPVGSITFADSGAPAWGTSPGRAFQPGTRVANASLNVDSISSGLQAITLLGGSSVDVGTVSSNSSLSIEALGTVNVNNIDSTSAVLRGGAINLNGVINTKGLVVAVSNGDITAGAGAQINANLGAGSAGVFMVAGANYTRGASWFEDQITGVSSTGGSINLSSLTSFTTQMNTSGDADGGHISLVAYKGSGGGFVSTPISTGIYTGGSGNGDNGGVYISAGADSPNAIQVNNVIETGSHPGAFGTGKIVLNASQAKSGYYLSHLSNATEFDYITDSQRGAGGIQVSGKLTAYATNLNLYAGTGGINISAVSCANLFASTTGALNFNGDVTAARLVGVANGTISINGFHGTVASPGGILLIGGSDIHATGNINTSNLAGNGGNATFIAGAAYQENFSTSLGYKVNSVSITGISATGGSVDLSNMDEFTTHGVNGSAGDGGDVALVAYRGTGGGRVITQSNINQHILTVGNGSGSSGDVLIAAGANSSDAIQINCTIETTSTFSETPGTGSITLSAVQPKTGFTLSTTGNFGVDSNSILGNPPESGGIDLNSGLRTNNASITLIAGGVVNGEDAAATHFVGSSIKINAGAIGTGLHEQALRGSSYLVPATIELNSGSGDTYFYWQGVDPATLSSGSGGRNFYLEASNSGIVTGGDLTFTGDVTFVTTSFTNAHALATTGGDIQIQSLGGGILRVDGGSGGSLSASGEIFVTTLADLRLFGATTYLSKATLSTTIEGGAIHVMAGSVSTATVTSILDTETLSFEGGRLDTFHRPDGAPGDTWVLINAVERSGSTYANLSSSGGLGDVNISGSLLMQGLNLAVIAGQNINFDLGSIIDLSGYEGGGSLTLLAGYSFAPGTNGVQVSDSTTAYGNFAVGPNAGNINASSTTFITSANSGNAGSVLAIANGNISMGNIDASSAGGSGGTVRLFAAGNLSVGSIDTEGASPGTSGSVLLANARPNIPSNVQVLAGTMVNSDSIGIGSASAGSMSYQTINAGAADVSVIGALTSQDVITAGGPVNALTFNLNTGAGAAVLSTQVTTFNSSSSGASWIWLENIGNLNLGMISGAGQKLTVVSPNQIMHNAGSIAIAELTLKASSFSLIGGSIGRVGGTVTLETSNEFVANSLGTVLGNQVNLIQSASMVDASFLNGVSTSHLVLKTTGNGANIGSSSTSRFVLPSALQVVTAISDYGAVFLSTEMDSKSTLTISGSAGGVNSDFDVLGTGNLNVGNISTLDGDINLITAFNKITVGNGSIVSAKGVSAGKGDLTLKVLDVSKNAKKTSFIELQSGAQLNTVATGTNGVITLSLGPETAPVAGKQPKRFVNVINQGGQVFWGQKAANFKNSVSTLHTKGTDIVFNNPYGKNISLTGASLFADPPVPEGTPILSFMAPSASGGSDRTAYADFALISKSSLSSLESALPALPSISSSLITQTSTNSISASLFSNRTSSDALKGTVRQDSIDDDNSYMVGYMGSAIGETDAAICSDVEVGVVSAGDVTNSQRGGALPSPIQRVQHSERVVIKKGSVLFVPFKATTVETPNGIVHIDAKSVVLVSSTDAGLAVYDLEDQHKGSVSVESNGHNVVLSPGRHVMVTKHHTAEFAQINAVETIAHRNVQSTVKNGHRAHTSEFSILTAVDTVRPLKALAMSKHANAKQIADRMLKTTAIILQIGGASGQYQHYFKPRMTAKM